VFGYLFCLDTGIGELVGLLLGFDSDMSSFSKLNKLGWFERDPPGGIRLNAWYQANNPEFWGTHPRGRGG
jgi:hypothetical protein